VPVSETSTLDSTQKAYETYAEWKKIQRPHTKPYDSKD
jgi:3D-(3,5/4)-trihydroxycyclohexane-1,2-dione acylhydrolase (decyclizing)